MLLEFGAYNFASFKEGFQVNLREKKNSLEAHTLMGIKGANASGKTNVLKVPSFLSFFVQLLFIQILAQKLILDLFSITRKKQVFMQFLQKIVLNTNMKLI